MLPMLIDGRQVLLAGMRENPNEAFRYLRLPIDAEGSLADFMRFRAAVLDPGLRDAASATLARQMLPPDATDTFRRQLAESAKRALGTFASKGFQSVAAFIENGVPEAERERAADVFVRLLNGAAFEAWQLRREKDGLKRLPATEATARFAQDCLNAMSDSFFYGAPVYLHLNSFDEVKASVFQLTRSPGKNIVYLGSLLLVLGVFAMLYIRERRAWVLVKPDGRVLFAMSALRRGVDDDREFARLRGQLGAQLGVQVGESSGSA
jgi:cytochrome c biogenesis protein